MADELPLHPPAAVATTLVPAIPPMQPDGGPPEPSFPIAPVAASPTQPTNTPPAAMLHPTSVGRADSVAASSVSALTPATLTLHAPPTASETPNKRVRDNPDPSLFESPSPKKPAPNFSKPISDDNSVMSGDDEEKWELEEARVMGMIVEQNTKDEELAEALEDLQEVRQVYEFEEMCADDDDPEEEAPPEKKILTQTVAYSNKFTVAMLKELYVHLGIGEKAPTSKKRELFDKIRDSDKVMKITDDSFSYEMEEEAVNEKSSGKGARWVVLTGLDCDLPEGFYASGVESGFFAPTNKDNHVGAPKKQYLTGEGEAIKRPEFGPKPKKDKKTGRPSVPPQALNSMARQK